MTPPARGRAIERDRLPAASYLVRFDDLCPGLNRRVWDSVEEMLVARGIRPIVGVVPDNRDPALMVDAPDPGFWARVRSWQERGWTIALHGYQHLYVTNDAGLFGWDDRSEFAGLTAHEQEDKLRKGLAIFEREGVRADMWMAPNHSFDRTTVAALAGLGIEAITDGLGVYPHRDDAGIAWLPVQLWWFLPRRLGVWTVCLHPNGWGSAELERFASCLDRFSGAITDVDSVLAAYGRRRRTWLDDAFALQRRARRFARRRGGRRR